MAVKKKIDCVFDVGDTVVLRAGGPDMTVTEVGKEYQGDVYLWCTWFAGRKNERARFPPEALKHAAPNEQNNGE